MKPARLLIVSSLSVFCPLVSGVLRGRQLPPQSVFIDPQTFAVLGTNGTFRQSAYDSGFNPTGTAPPFFQIWDERFLDILGDTPSIGVIAFNASNTSFAFSHEGPVFDPETGDLFFISNDGGLRNIDRNNRVLKLNMNDVERATANGTLNVNVPVTEVPLPDTVQQTGGGTGPYKGSILLSTSGRGPRPPALVTFKPSSPENATVLLDNFFGRQFNSLNDVKVHPGSGKIFFTDVSYGFLNRYRPEPRMPNQVYRFDPDTGAVRMVADGFEMPNGIAFTKDGNTAYITDSGSAKGFLGRNETLPATIYAFDVDQRTHAFKNRRVLAYVDSAVPDGIQVDVDGNIYSGAGDGTQIWDSEGTLLGKIVLGTSSANMVFAGDGRLVIMGETKVFLARIAARAFPLGG